jgi:hypothetical protein
MFFKKYKKFRIKLISIKLAITLFTGVEIKNDLIEVTRIIEKYLKE